MKLSVERDITWVVHAGPCAHLDLEVGGGGGHNGLCPSWDGGRVEWCKGDVDSVHNFACVCYNVSLFGRK